MTPCGWHPRWLVLSTLATGCAGPGDKTDAADVRDTAADSAAMPEPDRDADGWPDAEDCAPDDPAVHPAATESCNGADDNCDGAIDEAGAVGETAWYADGDGDGFGAGDATVACDASFGEVSEAADCNDADPAIHPAAAEVCGNGHDDNCDGGGQECRYEGFAELRDVAAFSEEPHAHHGFVVLGGGCDLDGDGLPEALVGAPWHQQSEYEDVGPGVGYILRGGDPIPATLDGAWASVARAEATGVDSLGMGVACGDDADRDGYNSLLIAGPVAWEESDEVVVHLLSAVVAGGQGVSAATATVTGDSGNPLLRSGGDTDGDGAGNFFVEVKLGGSSTYNYGLRGFSLDLTGDVTFDGASTTLDLPENVAIYSFAIDGDYDGDGVNDLVIGVNDLADTDDFVYAFAGPIAGNLSTADATSVLDTTGDTSSSTHNPLELSNLHDFDGDGRDDLVVGNATASSVAQYAGSVYVAPGPLPSSGSLADFPTRFTGLAYADGVGTCVAGPGDLDGDGNNDLLATAANYGDSTAAVRGAAHIVYGPKTGVLAIVDAGPTLHGSTDLETTGRDCAEVGDVTGDGLADFALSRQGAWDYSINQTFTTAGAYLVPGVAW